MRKKLSNVFVVLGIVFFVAGYLTLGFYLFGFVCLLVGIVLILLSTKSKVFKFTAVGIPIVVVAFKIYSSFTTPERYLIPENYKGSVMVIFNQKDGEKEEYEGRRRLYRIPPTGVLFTQFKDEQGFINQDYYYVSSSGMRKKLGVLDTRDFNEPWSLDKHKKEPPRDSLAVFNPGTMGTMGYTGYPNSKVFLELSVGTYNDLSHGKEITDEYIDSLKLAAKKPKYP